MIIRVWNLDPAYILTLDPTNIAGTVECRSNITLDLGRKTSFPWTKTILRQVLGAAWLSLKVFLFWRFKFDILITTYLNFVVLPQGVRGYLIDLVLPPCGWSTGLRATPRTLGFSPYDRQKPLFVLESLRFNFSAAGPNNNIE